MARTRQHVQKALATSRRDGIRSVYADPGFVIGSDLSLNECRPVESGLTIISGPCVRAVASCPVGEVIKNPFVWIGLRAQKDQMFQGMRATSIVKDLGSNSKVGVCNGSLVVRNDHRKSGLRRSILGNSHRSVCELELGELFVVAKVDIGSRSHSGQGSLAAKVSAL